MDGQTGCDSVSEHPPSSDETVPMITHYVSCLESFIVVGLLIVGMPLSVIISISGTG